MTILSKILLAVAIVGLAGGVIIDSHIGANPTLAVVLPIGAIALGLFLIVFMMESEMAKFDQEHAGATPNHQNEATQSVPAVKSSRSVKLPATTLNEIGGQQGQSTGGHRGALSFHLKSILVPIDFSDGSKKALQYAVRFAKEVKARIILLHVFPLFPVPGAEYEDEAVQRLQAWADEFVPGDVCVETQIRRGAEAIEIVNEAKQFEVGLMVISTHGRTGRAHALAGSLAENLVQLAPCPVLVVREHEQDFIETATGAAKPANNFNELTV